VQLPAEALRLAGHPRPTQQRQTGELA